MSERQDASRLGLTEAYHVVNRWLAHVGTPPQSISEPVDGVVELGGRGYHARIRIDSSPVPQGAVLAMIRAVGDPDALRMILFSVSGFTNGALVFADAQAIAAFELTTNGDVVPRNSHAKNLNPEIPLEPAFAKPVFVEPEPDSEPGSEKDDEAPSTPVDWRDCPRCGATHHPRANFCASCGADLHTRITLIGDETPAERMLGTKQHDQRSGSPVPRHTHTGPSLRCRTCGSDDIELIRPD